MDQGFFEFIKRYVGNPYKDEVVLKIIVSSVILLDVAKEHILKIGKNRYLDFAHQRNQFGTLCDKTELEKLEKSRLVTK